MAKEVFAQPDREHEPAPINPIQALQFEFMKQASFNGFDGDQVVADLVEHADLWRGAVMDRGYQVWNEEGEVVNFTKLRDIERGQWNVDTLFILTNGKDDPALEQFARDHWGADDVGYVEDPDMGVYPHPPDLKILRVWWE